MTTRTIYPEFVGTLLTVSTSFLSRDHIVVQQRAASDDFAQFLGTTLAEGVDYAWITDGQIELLTTATGTLDFLIQRITPSEPIVVQQPGVFSSAIANVAVLQAYYLAEEARDLITEGLVDSALRTDLDSLDGLKFTGFIQDAVGAVKRSGLDKARDWVDAEDFGAISGDAGEGEANSAKLQAALDMGVPVMIRRGKNYYFGDRLLVPTGGGFIGGGKLTMLTDAGHFDRAVNAGDQWQMVGVYALEVDDIVLQVEVVMQASASVRTCSPFAVRGCVDPYVDVKLSGFDAPVVPLVAWDSNEGGFARVRGSDCGTSDDSETR